MCKDLLTTHLCIYFRLCWVFIAGSGLCFFIASGGYSAVVKRGFLTAVASLMDHGLQGTWVSVVAARGLWSTGSVAVVHRSTCSAACGIFFLTQGSNPCLLHWQADFLPLSPPAKPCVWAFNCPKMISKVMLFVMKSPGAIRVCEQRRRGRRPDGQRVCPGHCRSST